MIYKVVWESPEHKSGDEIEISSAFLSAAFNEAKQHRGTMTDLVAQRTGLTRGDASRVVGEYYDQI